MARKKRKYPRVKVLPSGMKSLLEEDVARQLKKIKKIHSSYETDKFKYVLNERTYIPDFTVVLPSGRVLYIEAKGYLRPEDRTKMVAVKKYNPNADIRFLFSKDNKLNGKSQTRYSEWATKHGFQYAIGTVPKEWFNK